MVVKGVDDRRRGRGQGVEACSPGPRGQPSEVSFVICRANGACLTGAGRSRPSLVSTSAQRGRSEGDGRLVRLLAFCSPRAAGSGDPAPSGVSRGSADRGRSRSGAGPPTSYGGASASVPGWV